jgi:basic membrane protein A and related proteins
MKKIVYMASILLILLALLASGCTPAAPEAPVEEAPAEEVVVEEVVVEEAAPTVDPIRVALLLPGRVDDMSFNQMAYEGLKALKVELGEKVETTYTEGVYQVVDIEPALRDYADQGYDLIIGHGFQFQDPIMAVAGQYPDVNFAIGPGAFLTAPNVSLYDASNAETGYAMGTVAGLVSDSHVLGSIGGMDVPNVHIVHEVFMISAEEMNSETQIIHVYTGDFRDAEAAREAALSMVDQGADLIFVSGDGITVGGLEAAEDKGVLFMTSSDMSAMAPEIFLASLSNYYGVAYGNMVADIESGAFGDKKYELTFQNGGLELVVHLQDAAGDAIAQIDEVIKGLTEGTIEIPEVPIE